MDGHPEEPVDDKDIERLTVKLLKAQGAVRSRDWDEAQHWLVEAATSILALQGCVQRAKRRSAAL